MWIIVLFKICYSVHPTVDQRTTTYQCLFPHCLRLCQLGYDRSSTFILRYRCSISHFIYPTTEIRSIGLIKTDLLTRGTKSSREFEQPKKSLLKRKWRQRGHAEGEQPDDRLYVGVALFRAERVPVPRQWGVGGRVNSIVYTLLK